MAFTYTDFVNNISGMSISGVTRQHTAPPATFNTADLPASYPRIPEGDNQVITLSGGRGLRQAVVELVVVVEMVRQSSNAGNFSAALGLVDAMEAAFAANTITYGIDRWSIRQEYEQTGSDTWAWQLVARVEGSGT